LTFTRQRFQRGTLRKVARADNQWAWEYRYQDPLTRKRKSLYLSVEEFAKQTAAERHLEHLVLKLNDEHPALAVYDPPFDAILDRFIEDERLLEIKSIRPGERTEGVGELSYSTATGYLSNIKRIRERWGTTPISRMKPMKVQEWLKGLDLAPKTKGHIKAVMHRLFEKAMLWELVEWQRNPMQLVEIKGISKRRKRPVILTFDQFFLGFELVPQPYRTMVMLAICSGVRAEEVLAIEKPDIHFETLSLQLFRAVVHGRVKFVKTSCRSIQTSQQFCWTGFGSATARLGKRSKRQELKWPLPTFFSPVPSLDGTTTPHPSSRTTSVRLGAVSWHVQTVGQALAFGV
jgi:integrase